MGQVQELLDEAIALEERWKKLHFEKATLNMSDSLKCTRMRWFKYKGYPFKEYDARARRRFMGGRVAEKVLLGYLKYLGDVFQGYGQYVVHYIDKRIRGVTDFTLKLKDKIYICELKSLDGWGYYRRKKEPDKISLLYEGQALNYVDCLQSKEPIEDRAMIVELARDTFEIMENLTRPIGDVREELQEDWMSLIKWVDGDKIPPVIPGYPDTKECKWCSMRIHCKEAFAEGK